MGTDIAELSVIHHLTDAMRHAMLLYGDCVLNDPNLIEILRDHGAFNGYDCADDIISMLIDNGSMPRLLSISSRLKNEDILDCVDKEVCDLRYMCSLHEKDIRTVILSLIKGMNMNLDMSRIKSEDSYIADSIEIDPDDLIEPPSCPIPPRKTHKKYDEEALLTSPERDDIPLKSEITIADKETPKKNLSNRKRYKVYAAIFLSAIALAVGIFGALKYESRKSTTETIVEAETPWAERVYRGMTGKQVSNIVAGLDKADYLNAEDVTKVKGNYIYDETVERAVGHFQRDLGIRQDGVYKTALDGILFSFWRPELTSCRLGERKLTVSDPKSGPDVDVLIEILNDSGFPPDTSKFMLSDAMEYTERVGTMFAKAGSTKGEEIAARRHHYYSEDIEKSLKAFQASNGIQPSGDLNAATLRALKESYLRIKEKKPSSYDARPVGL